MEPPRPSFTLFSLASLPAQEKKTPVSDFLSGFPSGNITFMRGNFPRSKVLKVVNGRRALEVS